MDSLKSPGRPRSLRHVPGAGGTLHHLRRALARLREEEPKLCAAIAGHLRRAPGKYLVGRERFTVVAARSIAVVAGWRVLGTTIEAEISPQAIVDLFDGVATVEQLVARGILRIKGDAAALLGIFDATRALAVAGLQSRALQIEFERYRTWVLNLPREERYGVSR